MNYEVSLLATRADCQVLIDNAVSEKESLNYRKSGLVRNRRSAGENSVSVEADLHATIAEVAANQTRYDSLPEGNAKQEALRQLKKAQYKQFLLEQRRLNYGSLSLLDKDYDIACIDHMLAETDDFILQLTTRMNQLP